MLNSKDLNIIATIFFITILGHATISFLISSHTDTSDPFGEANEILIGGLLFYLLSNFYLYFVKIKKGDKQ